MTDQELKAIDPRKTIWGHSGSHPSLPEGFFIEGYDVERGVYVIGFSVNESGNPIPIVDTDVVVITSNEEKK